MADNTVAGSVTLETTAEERRDYCGDLTGERSLDFLHRLGRDVETLIGALSTLPAGDVGGLVERLEQMSLPEGPIGLAMGHAAAALRSLAAERDALAAHNAKLQRDIAPLIAEVERLTRERANHRAALARAEAAEQQSRDKSEQYIAERKAHEETRGERDRLRGKVEDEEVTEAMAVAGRKALVVVADRMEEAKLLARSSIDFWQRVGHHPANEIYRAMRLASLPAPEDRRQETTHADE